MTFENGTQQGKINSNEVRNRALFSEKNYGKVVKFNIQVIERSSTHT